MSGDSGFGTLGARAFNRLLQEINAPAITVQQVSGGASGKSRTFYEPGNNDITIQLPPAGDFENLEIFLKRIGVGFGTVTFLPDGADRFNGEATFDRLVLATRDEWVTLKAEIGRWEIIKRNTFAIATLLINTPVEFEIIEDTPIVVTDYQATQTSTPGRTEADAVAGTITTKVLELTDGDLYRLNANVLVEYRNNQCIMSQVYADGVPIEHTLSSHEGEGGDDPVQLRYSGQIKLNDVRTLDLRLWGTRDDDDAVIHRAEFGLEMVRG